MAEAGHQVKIPSLAEQWSLVEKDELADYDSTFGQGTIKTNSATVSEEIASDKIVQTPVAEENAKVSEQQEVTESAPIVKENITSPEQMVEHSREIEEKQKPIENAPTTEANIENTNPEEEQVQEVEGEEESLEETPMIKIETAPADFRFPTTNQTRHCFTRYIEYHRCIDAKGDDAPECQKFAKYYRSLCPGEWIDRWNEQRENGTFPGPL